MLRPEQEQSIIDEEVERAAEALRQLRERERDRAEHHPAGEEHWRSAQESQRLTAELARETAEEDGRLRSASAAELEALRQRVASLEQMVIELWIAHQSKS